MPPAPLLRRLVLIPAALFAGCATAPSRVAPPPASAAPELRIRYAAEPGNADLGWRLAAALRAGGHLAEARRVLDESLAEHPDHGPSLQLLGSVLEGLGDDGQAASAYERFLASPDAAPLRAEVEARLAAVRRRMLVTEVRAALRQEALLADTPPLARTVAVFPFSYVGTDDALRPLARALTHMLVTDLSVTDRLTVLERLEVQLLTDEIARTDEGLIDPATGVRGGRLLGAERVIQGQIGGGEARIDLTAGVVVSAGDSAATATPTRVEADDAFARFFDLETQFALELYDAIGIQLTAAERERVGQRPTESLEALLAFGLGLEAQDAGRYEEARGHFEQAVALDPGFSDATTALETATRLETAAAQNVDVFAGLGGALVQPTPEELWRDRRATYRGIEGILPTLGTRDPWSELLDEEGLAPGAGTIVITIPRPGGER